MGGALPLFANSVVERCSSTNDLARQLARAGASHGCWVAATRQDAGRGRSGRTWATEKGNLFISIVLRPSAREYWTWIPLAVAVGVARAVLERLPGLELRIKWPNDLWISSNHGGAKFGGILCEASAGGAGRSEEMFVIAGIGLNCLATPELPEPPLYPITNLSEAAESRVTADELRESVIREVLTSVRLDSAEDLMRLRAAFEERALFRTGELLEWGAAEARGRGILLGLGDSGELRVERDDGELVQLFAEDVSVRRSLA